MLLSAFRTDEYGLLDVVGPIIFIEINLEVYC